MNRWKRLIFILSVLLNAACAFYFVPKIWRKLNESQITMPKISYWMERDHYFELLPEDSLAIVFLGTSITQNFELEEAFRIPHLQNRGINGDQLRGMNRRMGAITRQQPRAIFIEAGINDLGDGECSPEYLRSEMNRLLDRIQVETQGTCEVYVLGLLPVANTSDAMQNYCSPEINAKIKQTNALYRTVCAANGTTYIDVHSAFVADGAIEDSFTTDGVHLSGEGYMKLADILRPYVKKYQ